MGRITVIGTGFEAGQLTLEAAELLRSGRRIILHTGRCGCAEWLRTQGIAYETLDSLYESCDDFDVHARAAAEAVIAASQDQDVLYGVFDVRDESGGALLQQDPKIRILAGPPAEGALFAGAQGSVQMMAASDWETVSLSSGRSVLIREMDSRELASEVKLKLMDVYPDESAVFISLPGGMARTQLYNLDRMKSYDHRTCALVPAVEDLAKLERYDFDRLYQIISILLSPDGCPWDRVQTHQSLRPYLLAEAYEAAGAIDDEDPYHLCDELGDVLLQVMLHAEIGRRHGEFAINDVITDISEKMIRRHSHIFGHDAAKDAGEVSDLWTHNKMAERGQTTYTETLRDVSHSMPAPMRAAKVLKRLDEACGCKDTLEASLNAAKAGLDAIETGSEREIGEALFKLIGVAREAKVDPELALNGAVDRLIERFEHLECEVSAHGEHWDELSPQVLREYWDLVKLADSGKERQDSNHGGEY